MTLRVVAIVLLAGSVLIPAPLRAVPVRDPGTCPSDSKLLNDGPTSVFGDGPGTWWGLVIDGLVTAGITQDADQLAFLNGLFGTEFGTLADMKAFNLQLVSDGWDKNQNGYVCAYELRGTRAHFEDPLINTTSFGISDDKIRRK